MEEKGRPGNSCGLTDIAHCRRGITLRGKESYRAIVDVAAGPLALADRAAGRFLDDRSEEHTSELQSLMRISYAVFCLKQKKTKQKPITITKYPIHNRGQ